MSTPTQFATPDDVRAVAYGLDIQQESDAEVQALINKAQRRLLNRAPGITRRLNDGQLTTAEVTDVIVDIVLRVVRNPVGVESEQAGEFSYRINWAAASGRIHITSEDLKNLGIGTGAGTSRSIRSSPSKWRLR